VQFILTKQEKNRNCFNLPKEQSYLRNNRTKACGNGDGVVFVVRA